MTRSDLAVAVAYEIAERGADRDWICSLIDRALEVGHIEAQGRAEKIFGPFIADMLKQPNGWVEVLDIVEHMPSEEFSRWNVALNAGANSEAAIS